MTLQEFLVDTQLNAIEVLPDNRLINVIVDENKLCGVYVDNIPYNVAVTRTSSVIVQDNFIYANNLVFDTTQYEMLPL